MAIDHPLIDHPFEPWDKDSQICGQKEQIATDRGVNQICGRIAAAHRRMPGMGPSAPESPGDRHLNQALVRAADAAQYAREAIPEEQRGQIRVRLLNATPDPLGSIAALCKQYKGEVVRSLSEVTDAERREYLEDLGKTVLNGPLESVQFHFQIEGVTRSITHQMVRSRASFFAQESLRFAVPEGDWAQEIPLPPYLSRTKGNSVALGAEEHPVDYARNMWDEHMRNAARTYQGLIDCGMPAEEARGVLPHDMPTRIHWVLDLRTLLAEAGKRTCTQAQFPWRMIFAGIARELRNYRADQTSYADDGLVVSAPDAWQFSAIADRLRPVCFQTGSCGFMAKFDRSCSIRERVDAFGKFDVPPEKWGEDYRTGRGKTGTDGTSKFYIDILPWADRETREEIIPAINNAEWAADPGAARS